MAAVWRCCRWRVRRRTGCRERHGQLMASPPPASCRRRRCGFSRLSLLPPPPSSPRPSTRAHMMHEAEHAPLSRSHDTHRHTYLNSLCTDFPMSTSPLITFASSNHFVGSGGRRRRWLWRHWGGDGGSLPPRRPGPALAPLPSRSPSLLAPFHHTASRCYHVQTAVAGIITPERPENQHGQGHSGGLFGAAAAAAANVSAVPRRRRRGCRRHHPSSSSSHQ